MPKKVNKLKKAKRLKNSSQKWILRQINDPLVKKAQQQGYRSRAAFKIIEVDEKFKIFKKRKIVLDLGAAPGGWSQVAVDRAGENNVFAVDLLEMSSLFGAHCLQLDFLDEDAPKIICDLIKEKTGRTKCDVLLSDMASNTTGDKRLDHLRIMNLLEDSLRLGEKIMNYRGSFVGKLFQGASSDNLVKLLRKNFQTVKYFKPESSRKDSTEIYLVAMGFGVTKEVKKTKEEESQQKR